MAAAATPTLRRRAAEAGPPGVGDLVLGCSGLAGMFAPLPGGEPAAVGAVGAALELGARAFDSAPHYGLGLSEERLGAGLRAHGARGGAAAEVWTKVGRVLVDERADPDEWRLLHEPAEGGGHPEVEWANTRGHAGCIFPETPAGRVPRLDYSAAGVRRSYEASVQRLGPGAGRLVGLRVHDCETEERAAATLAPGGALEGLVSCRAPGRGRGSRADGVASLGPDPARGRAGGPDLPVGAAIKSQVGLKAEGKIRSAGIGVNDPGFALRVLRGAPPGALDAVMIAGCWNLLDQSAYPLLLECQARGVEVRCRMTLPPSLPERVPPGACWAMPHATRSAASRARSGRRVPATAAPWPLRLSSPN